MNSKTSHARPYWHVDLKWIFGILALLAVVASLFTAGLYRLTSREPAIALTTTAIASAFSPDGLDESASLADLQAELAASENGEFIPFPGLNVVVRADEIAGMSAREVRMYIFAQLAGPLYDHGADAVDRLVTDPNVAPGDLAGQLGVAAFFTATAHKTTGFVLVIMCLVAAVLCALTVLFSRRFGRLVSPGVLFMIAAVPGFVLFWLLQVSTNQAKQVAQETQSLTTVVTREALPFVISAFKPVYAWALLVGLALFTAALVGVIVARITHARRNKQNSKKA